MSGRRWIFKKHFDGMPKAENMKLEAFDLPSIKDGEVLLEAVSLSVDPYMRVYDEGNNKDYPARTVVLTSCGSNFPTGSVMMNSVGEQVARVIESKNKDYPVGTVVLTLCGWTTHSVSDGSKLTKVEMPKDVPLSLALGAAGMTGLTAYFGLIEVCNPKAGETVMVSGAAGAVGSVVGQIAKILGCRVIGSAGTDAKVALLKEMGFDEAFNYKTIKDLKETIKAAAPKGVDVYFDNVGGEMAASVINGMNLRGRVACCGAISQYNARSGDDIRVQPIGLNVVSNRLMIQGFVVWDFLDTGKYPAGRKQLVEWIQQGKLKPIEHITNGFENMYAAFQELFTGANTGKAVVNV